MGFIARRPWSRPRISAASPAPGSITPGSGSPGSGSPGSGSPAPSSPAPAPGPVFRTNATVLTAAMRARMTGVSWHRGCPVSLDALRLLRVSYWGFDHHARQGELVVRESAVAGLARAFRMLFEARFPIRQMRVVDFGGDDERSMLSDNTLQDYMHFSANGL